MKQSRSRKGCVECKRRKVACDESKPSCKKCVKRGHICRYEFQLKFKEDFQTKAFGREGVWKKNGSASNSIKSQDLSQLVRTLKYLPITNLNYYFINTDEFDLNFIERPLRKFPFLKNDDLNYDDVQCFGMALDYYLQYIIPIFNPVSIPKYKEDFNIYTVLRYCYNNQGLLCLIIAIGCKYLVHNNNLEFWEIKSIYFKESGLRHLAMSQSDDKIDMLLSTLLCCIYDISDDCNDNWSEHLNKCKQLLKEMNNINHFETSLIKFIIEFFGYQEAMGRTACKKLSVFSSEYWNNENSISSWMGCDKRLVGLISDITDLTYERISPSVSEDKYVELSMLIEKRLEMIKVNDIGEFFEMKKYEDLEEFCFLLGCECKRLSALLYHHCSLMNHSPLQNYQIVIKLAKYLKFIIIENKKYWTFLIWPVFIMSSQIIVSSEMTEYLRSIALQMLNELEKNTLGNVNKTREIILDIWKKRDLKPAVNCHSCSPETPHGHSYLSITNDWEAFVANKKYNISLA